MKLRELDPHFLKRTQRFRYQQTDDIRGAAALMLRCPACHWSAERNPEASKAVHSIVLWKPEPEDWRFEGTGYDDLSLAAGRIPVTMTAGCRASFRIKRGKVDFS
jgi:hypothetical protein